MPEMRRKFKNRVFSRARVKPGYFRFLLVFCDACETVLNKYILLHNNCIRIIKLHSGGANIKTIKFKKYSNQTKIA
jgi:hypothetical protein